MHLKLWKTEGHSQSSSRSSRFFKQSKIVHASTGVTMKKNFFITCFMILLLAFSGFFVLAQETKEQKETTKEEQKAQKEAQKKAEKEQKKVEKKQKKEDAKIKSEEAAQKEAEEPTRGHFFISIEDWYTKISNVDYDVATKYDDSFEESENLTVQSTNGDTARYRLGWIFKNNLGTIEMNNWGFSNDDELIRTDPGSFTFVQNLSFPLYAGVLDDGLADGASGFSHYSIRSFSLLYSRQLAKSERMTSQWKIGLRKVTYNHTLQTEYLALAPEFITPFLPEESLMPKADTVLERSLLEARGIETGICFFFPLSKKVSFSSELGYSLLNGHADAEYTSRNHYYTSGGSYINPGENELESGDVQEVSVVSIKERDLKTNINILDANLKLNWNVWRTFDLTLGYAYSVWNGALIRNQVMLVETLPGFYSQTSRLSRSNISFDGPFLSLSYRY